MTFRIFQDMRGVQATYRITPSSTTELAAAVNNTDDIIYVTDASALSEPNFAADFNINFVYSTGDVVMYDGLFYQATGPTTGNLPTDTAYWLPITGAANTWGVLTIDGERVMYRERDTVNNTVSGLLRGTAGTAVTAHSVGSLVYEMGRGNLLPAEDQNYIVNTSVLADGTTVLFVAENIDITTLDSTTVEEAVEVYVGGIRLTSGYTITGDSPVTVVFTTAPASGSEVTILIRRGVTWYQGTGAEPSDGVALQDTQTQAARFLRGQ
jgi:hypothetical protein